MRVEAFGRPARSAGMARLKVFRTPAGFDDAYVAAPSRKAALAAWGSDADLFARGLAEEVSDPSLTEAPLARPGEVIRVRRTMADATPETPRRVKSAPAPKPARKPSRRALDAADQALADAETRHADALAALRREEDALAKRRRTIEASNAAEMKRLETARNDAHEAYRSATAQWRGGDLP